MRLIFLLSSLLIPFSSSFCSNFAKFGNDDIIILFINWLGEISILSSYHITKRVGFFKSYLHFDITILTPCV